MAAVPWDRIVQAFREYILGPIGVGLGDLYWFAIRIPRFLLVVFLFYLLGQVTVRVLRHSFFVRDEEEDHMIQSLLESLIFVVAVLVGVGFGLMVYGINLLNLVVTVGLIGAGLALGLRNSVANIMGGIALATDQPFEVGDRIQIGEFWGDVVEIGLRSTRVLTARREYVVIPNSLMDEREIWNYTKEYDELRIEIEVAVSYDSDVERARRIISKIARDHERVQPYPEPKVLARDFQDSGVGLELWCFIENARQRYHIGSDLRTQIHKALREHGVEIPYSYRTLVEKPDLPEPERGVPEEFAVDELGPRRLLVATSGAKPARRKARTIVELAADLEADIVLAYITSRASILSEREGETSAKIFEDAATHHDVDVKLVTEEGDIVQAVRDLVKQEGCRAAVVGASRQTTLGAWRRAQVEDRLESFLDVPVIVVPPSLEIDERQKQEAREALEGTEAGGGEDRAP